MFYVYRGKKVQSYDSCVTCGSTIYPWDDEIVCDGERKALLVSEPHHRLRNGAWSGGGPFYTFQAKLEHGTETVAPWMRNGSDAGVITSKGCAPGPRRLPTFPLWLDSGVPSWDSVRNAAEADFATGWARARPGNPVASLGQFIIELKDLPAVPFKRALQGGASFRSIPKIALRELSDFKNLGSEYLNVVFGWKPFVADLRKMYNLWHDIDKRMAQIVRENGKYIRRRSGVQNTVDVSEEAFGYYPYPYVNVYGQPPSWPGGSTLYNSVRTTKVKSWFSGSFRYYIPDTSSSLWDARARLALFGALPTPELLWEVLPWSWLVDWFSNVGDVISNASPNAVDGLTSRYAYIMMRTETTVLSTSHVNHQGFDQGGQFAGHWPARDASYWTRYSGVSKARSGGGNPFGLNVQFDSLSGGQLAILAALGLSRSSVK